MSGPGDTDTPHRTPDVLRLITSIGSPVALASTLLLYFGWVRSDAQAKAFGAEVDVFGMSPQDLVLRSVDALFWPLLLVLLGWLLLLRLRPVLERHAATAGRVLRWAWLAVVPGLVLVLAAPGVGRVLLPGWVLVAIGGTAYGNRLRRGPEASPSLAVTAVVGALLVVAAFWQTERLASTFGGWQAEAIQADPGEWLSSVALVSGTRLHVTGPGVREVAFGGGESAFRYCYSGLFLLQHSGGKHFLLTGGWNEDRGRLIAVADTEDVRLEFGEGARCARGRDRDE